MFTPLKSATIVKTGLVAVSAAGPALAVMAGPAIAVADDPAIAAARLPEVILELPDPILAQCDAVLAADAGHCAAIEPSDEAMDLWRKENPQPTLKLTADEAARGGPWPFGYWDGKYFDESGAQCTDFMAIAQCRSRAECRPSGVRGSLAQMEAAGERGQAPDGIRGGRPRRGQGRHKERSCNRSA
jgi:hypothetical protein